jgi:hypothetical protein
MLTVGFRDLFAVAGRDGATAILLQWLCNRNRFIFKKMALVEGADIFYPGAMAIGEPRNGI